MQTLEWDLPKWFTDVVGSMMSYTALAGCGVVSVHLKQFPTYIMGKRGR
jgi:hypothetical protein